MRKFYLFYALTGILLTVSGTLGTSAEEKNDTEISRRRRLQVIYQGIDRAYADMLTLQADIIQVKTTQLLTEPVVSRGVFSYQHPDRMRWQYDDPDPITITINHSWLLFRYMDMNEADLIDISGFQTRIFRYIGIGQSSQAIRRHYQVNLLADFRILSAEDHRRFLPDDLVRVKPEPDLPVEQLVCLEMVPESTRLQRRLSKLVMWLDTANWLPVIIQIRQTNADSLTLFLQNMRTNSELPADHFSIDLPESVVVRKTSKPRMFSW